MLDQMINEARAWHEVVAPRSVQFLNYALDVAVQAHEGQLRKYTDDPYVVHPIRVARMVGDAFPDITMIAAAYLHDVIEDCGMTEARLVEFGFGADTARLVDELSNRRNPGNRATRKELDRQRLATVSWAAKTVKCADLIDNSCSIVTHDPKFAKVFMAEKSRLLEVLGHSEQSLYRRAWDVVNEYERVMA